MLILGLFRLVFGPSLTIFDTQLTPVLVAKDVAEKTSYNLQAGILIELKKSFVRDDDSLDQRFSIADNRLYGPVLYLSFTSSEIGIILTTCVFVLFGHP